jgi:hypothetical protein
MSLFLFKWHTGTQLKSTVLIKFKTVSLSFWETHWHMTQVYCTARIQNCISFFSGGTLAHHSSPLYWSNNNYISLFSGGTLAHNSSTLYSSNSQLHLFLFGWHTGTRLKNIVQIEFSTASLSFRVADWHMTQVHSTDRIQNCISLFSGGTLAHDLIHCTARIQNCITFFSGGTRAHYSILLYLANSKLYLVVLGWHTGTQLKYMVQLEFTTASLSFQVAHSHTTQAYCTARNQNCISLFFGGTLAHDSSPLYWSNS